MTVRNENIAVLYARFRQAWSIETSRHWRADNPAAGQCGVTALFVNDMLGGSVLKTDVNGSNHFYNIVDGRRIDMTISQFSIPIFYEDTPSSREEALLNCYPDQYVLLGSRVRDA